MEGPRKTIVSLPVQARRLKIRTKMDIGITKVLDWISSKTELLPWTFSSLQHCWISSISISTPGYLVPLNLCRDLLAPSILWWRTLNLKESDYALAPATVVTPEVGGEGGKLASSGRQRRWRGTGRAARWRGWSRRASRLSWRSCWPRSVDLASLLCSPMHSFLCCTTTFSLMWKRNQALPPMWKRSKNIATSVRKETKDCHWSSKGVKNIATSVRKTAAVVAPRPMPMHWMIRPTAKIGFEYLFEALT